MMLSAWNRESSVKGISRSIKVSTLNRCEPVFFPPSYLQGLIQSLTLRKSSNLGGIVHRLQWLDEHKADGRPGIQIATKDMREKMRKVAHRSHSNASRVAFCIRVLRVTARPLKAESMTLSSWMELFGLSDIHGL